MKLLRSVLTVLFIINSLVLILAYFGSLFSISLFYTISLLLPLWIGLEIAFAIVWMFLKSRLAFSAIFLILLGFWNWSNWFGSNKSVEQKSDSWSILSNNVQVFNKNVSGKVQANSFQDFKDMLWEEDPSIICLQEFYSSNKFNTLDSLKAMGYPHQIFTRSVVVGNRKWGLFTASKYPVERIETLKYDEKAFAHFVRVAMPGKEVLVVNTHLSSNRLSSGELDHLGDLQKATSELEGTKSIGKKLRRAFKGRKSQSRQIHDFLGSVDSIPIVLCGDFNDPPHTYTYRRMRGKFSGAKKLADAHLRLGKGIGSTYNGRIPFLRIDYILFSKDLEPFKYERLDFSRFDHFPIVTHFNRL